MRRPYPPWQSDGVAEAVVERRGTFWPGLKTIHSLLDEMAIGEAPQRPQRTSPPGATPILRVLVAVTAGLFRRRGQ